jgi:flagellar biosynthesis/type III secretory pathway M-ring protein FliF/YscJ
MTLDAVWKFFTDNALARWIAALLVALLGWEAVKRHLRDAGRKAEREASAVKQAQAREAVATRSAELISEERGNSDEALKARDSGGGHPSSSVVPDPVAAILFRDDKAG